MVRVFGEDVGAPRPGGDDVEGETVAGTDGGVAYEVVRVVYPFTWGAFGGHEGNDVVAVASYFCGIC